MAQAPPSNNGVKVLFAVTEDWYFWSHRKPLASVLRSIGCEIFVASRFQSYEVKLASAGFECIPIPFERSLRHPLRDLRTIIGLWLAVRRVRPEIVHLVSLKPILLSCLALLLHRRSRFIAAFTGMGYLFSSQDRGSRRTRRAVVAVLRKLLQRSNIWVVVQNSDDLALLRTERLGDPDRLILIPGVGVDTNEFAFAELATADAPIVVLPARLIGDKGIEEFVGAARLVNRTNPKVRFALVGAHDRDNPAAIPPAVIDAWVDEGAIEWWGHRQDMLEVYHEAQIVCLPSYREGLPKVLLEAAACGRPLIASDVPGCRDICRNGVNGTLVSPRRIEPLAAAIIQLLSSTDTQRKYGKAGRQIIENEYSVEYIGQQTFATYQKILRDIDAS